MNAETRLPGRSGRLHRSGRGGADDDFRDTPRAPGTGLPTGLKRPTYARRKTAVKVVRVCPAADRIFATPFASSARRPRRTPVIPAQNRRRAPPLYASRPGVAPDERVVRLDAFRREISCTRGSVEAFPTNRYHNSAIHKVVSAPRAMHRPDIRRVRTRDATQVPLLLAMHVGASAPERGQSFAADGSKLFDPHTTQYRRVSVTATV